MALKHSQLTAEGTVVTWSISSLPNQQKQLLCVGYGRHYSDKLIPSDIHGLIQRYYSFGEVSIQDIHQMNDFSKQPLLSPVFQFNNLHWYLEFWPSGYSRDGRSTNKAELYLCLLTETENPIEQEYTLSLVEGDFHCRDCQTFKTNLWWYRKWKCVSPPTEHMQAFDSITFQCEFETKKTFIADQEGLIQVYTPTASIVPSVTDSYTWSIDDSSMIAQMCAAPNVHGFCSPIFEMHGFKWYLTVSPNGSKTNRKGEVTLSLNLASLPDPRMKLLVSQKLLFNDKLVEFHALHHADSHGSKGISHSNWYCTADLKGMKRFCFTAEIALIAVIGGSEEIDKLTMNSIDENKSLMPFAWELKVIMGGTQTFCKTFEFYGFQWKIETPAFDGPFKISLLSDTRDTVCVRFRISLLETETRFIMSGMFGGNKRSKDWGTLRVDRDQLLGVGLERLTIQLQMEMIAIYK